MKKYIIMIITLLTICGLSAYDETYVVNQNGPGDYTDIMSAVNAVQTSAIIYVVATPSAYTGTNNNNITWDGSEKHIYLKGMNNPVIQPSAVNNRAFIFDDDDIDQTDIISGFTIEDFAFNEYYSPVSEKKGVGILIKNGASSIIENCIIDGCYMADYGYGTGIYVDGAATIRNCTIKNTISWDIYGGSGMACRNDVTIENCIFENNFASASLGERYSPSGAGIYILPGSTGNPTINNCIFLDNYLDGDGEGSAIFVEENTVGSQSIDLSFNTFLENDGHASATIFFEAVTSEVELVNCIFSSNTCDDYVIECDDSQEVDCDYSLFFENEDYYEDPVSNGNCSFGSDIISEEDPELNSTTYQPQWLSSVKSPCIDAGDPTITDDDNTPSDIGAVCAINHRIDEIELPPPTTNNGWKWLSFPALDNVLNDADVAENVLEDILDPTILDKVEAEDYTILYYNNQWWEEENQFLRTEGFKFHMNAAADLDVPGFKEYDNTTIILAGNNVENWVGYWLEETQHVSEAFEDYWSGSNIHFIQHQFWTAYRWEGEWYYRMVNEVEPTLSYGDMVVVKCLTTINNFQWESGITVNKTVFTDPEYFTYEEQADYVPLFIELDGSDMPQEIGAFVNGECIGATVVSDTLTQINAYTTSVPPGDIELELYYGNRSENKIISSYNCVTSTNPDLVMKQLTTKDKDDAWFIDLREDSSMTPTPKKMNLDNYPNPFNPTTIISYSLPNDGMIELKVYNIKGQLVKTLVKGEQLSGSYETVWSGKDNNEKNVSSGIYFYKLSTKDETIMKKMLMLK